MIFLMLTPRQIKESFAERLALLRRALGFRYIKDFAEHLEIGIEALYKYEQGSRIPSPYGVEFQKIRRRTGATADWLLYGNEDTLPTPLRLRLQQCLAETATRQPDEPVSAEK